MNKRIVITLTGILSLISSSAFAAHGWYGRDTGYYDRARVLKVEPITTTVQVAVPQRECYQQEVLRPVYTHRSDGAALVGGIIGSVIGNNIGMRHGRHHAGATVAGAIIGAAVGRSIVRDSDTHYDEVSYENRCAVRTRYETQEQLIGYRVTYRYHGDIYKTRMDNAPGKFIQVRVGISPIVE